MKELIGEQVEVAMIYAKDRRRTWPCLIRWRHKRWRTSAVGFKHYLKKGRILIHIYELEAEGNLWMRLEHNTLYNTWTLEAVSDGQAE